MVSGLGGLGLDGMVGMEESDGENTESGPGDGSNGVTSGDIAGEEDDGEAEKYEGEAEIVEEEGIDDLKGAIPKSKAFKLGKTKPL
ncbi:hypothetical protein QQ045_005557 [Rhodiola kirilowii]